MNDSREGVGKMVYRTGNVYFGEWKANERHGQGTMTWVDRGEMYRGEWVKGQQQGKGEHVWYIKRMAGSQVCMCLCARESLCGLWSVVCDLPACLSREECG